MSDDPRPTCIAEAARFVAEQPGAAERLLAVHVADASGHCRGCRQHERPTPAWPCVLVAIARLALYQAPAVAYPHRTPLASA